MLTAWVCPFTRTVSRTGEAAAHTLLLVSHVDYVTGQDIIYDVIDAIADDPLAAQTAFTVLVDGAHGVGNHCSIQDVAKLHAAFEEKLHISNFVYLYDHNKWLHGYAGLAVSLHTGVRAPSIESIFPRRPRDGFTNFQEPVSVSFNPLLPQWIANFSGPCANAFDSDRMKANERMVRIFADLVKECSLPGVEVGSSNTNIVLLECENPTRLHRFLDANGFRSHLMGASTIRGHSRGGRGGVRLAFSSHSVQEEDVVGLVSTLRRFR